MNTESQSAWIFTQLTNGRKLSAFEAAREIGCFRLAARVNDLRKKGVDVKTYIHRDGSKHWAIYYIEQG